MATSSKHPLLRKILRWLGIAVGGLLGLIVVVVVAALLSLNLAPTRSFVAKQANAALATMFQGKLVLDRIGKLSLSGVGGLDASVYDKQGRRVLRVNGLSVDLRVTRLVWDAVVRRPEVLVVKVDSIAGDHVEVTLIDDGTGTPTIASAFEPREPSEPTQEGGGTVIALDQISLEHVWAHGGLQALPIIDVELANTLANLHIDPSRTRFVLEKMQLEARSLPTVGTARGQLQAQLSLPSAPATPAGAAATPRPGAAGVMKARGNFKGAVAGADLSAQASMDGDKVDALVEAPAVSPETLSRLVPSLRTQGPTSLRARAEGTLPDLRFDAEVLGSAGRVTLAGTAQVAETQRVSATLRVSEVNLAALLPEGAKSNLALEARVDAQLAADEALSGTYRVEALPSQYESFGTPHTVIEGKLVQPAGGALSTEGTANIEEPGAPTRIAYDVQVGGSGGTIAEARLNTRFAGPSRLAGLVPGLSLGGTIDAQARVEPDADRLNATVNANLSQLRQGTTSVQRLTVKASAAGSLSAPSLQARLQAAGVSAGERRLKLVDVTASGTQKRLNVGATIDGKDPDRVQLSTVVGLDTGVSLQATSVVIADEHGKVTLGADSVQVVGSRVSVSGVKLEGAGTVEASAVYAGTLRRVQLSTQNLDVPRLARMFGADLPVKSALVSVQATYSGEARAPEGQVRGNIEQVGFSNVKNGELGLDLVIARQQVSGNLNARLGGAARAEIALDDVSLLEPPFTQAKLQQLKGAIAMEGHIDLRQLMPLLRMADVPFESARGVILFALRADRNSKEPERPTLVAHVETRSLHLIGERTKTDKIETAAEAREAEPWTITGIDGRIGFQLDREAQLAEFRGSLYDRLGDLVLVEGETRFAGLGGLAAAQKNYATLPLRASLSVPPRAFEKLPDLIRPKSIAGVGSLQVDADGTVGNPRLRAAGRVKNLRAGDGKLRVDTELNARYERTGGELALEATGNGRRVGLISAQWTGELPKLLEERAPDQPSPVRANIEAKLERFPLGVIPELYNRQIRGPLSLDLELKDFGRNASLSGTIDGSGVILGLIPVQELKGTVLAEGDELAGQLRMGGNRGFVQVQLRTNMRWGSKLVPQIDPDLVAQVTAQRFRIETLQPLLGAAVSELRGRLDANLKARMVKGVPTLDGTASLERGVIQLPAIGQRFSDIDARLVIHEDQIRLERLTARGVTGRVSVAASARVQGLDVRAAKAQVRIEEDEKLPITVEGVSMGDAWGNINVTFENSPENARSELRVNIPTFHLEMPEGGQPGIQNLEPAEGVRVGTHRRDGGFVTLPVQPLEKDEDEDVGPPAEPTTSVIIVQFGDSVWIKRGRSVEAQLGGRVQVLSENGNTAITGRIEVRGGSLEVSGKTFAIERGVVTFDGADPSNPTVTAVARWDSPAGYTVYAEYLGTAQAGTLNLRSEPPLTQDQIISLLMFGTPDGSFGSGGGGGTAGTAVSAIGGTVAQGLNQALSSVTDLEVSARIDTSTGTARPEIVMQLTPRVTARVTRAVGEPAAGQSPDRTFLTVELRLLRAWALSAVLGDRGATALDLIWRRRY